MNSNETIPPHGGTLVNLLATEKEAARGAEEAGHLPKVEIGRRELSDLEMMAVGALSPLTGFMGEKDYRSVLEEMHLENGLPWTIPVTLSLDQTEAKRIGGASRVALVSDGRPIALVDVEQIYRRDREAEARSVFVTTDTAHPGVAALNEAGEYVVGGQVRVLGLPEHTTFQEFRRVCQKAAKRMRGLCRSIARSTAPVSVSRYSTLLQVLPPSCDRKTPRSSFGPNTSPSAAT